MRARFLCLSFIAFIFSASVVQAGVIGKPANNLGLVGYWSLNEGAASVFGDASGNKQNGNLLTASWAQGVYGKGIRLAPGSTADISDFNRSLLPATITAWVKVTATQDVCDGIVFSRNGPFVSGITINCTDASRVGYTWNDDINSYNWAGGPQYPINKWFMVALVVESTRATMYVISPDGATSSVNVLAHSASTLDNIKLGLDEYTARTLDGYLDEVRIYNRALSAVEIGVLYKTGSSQSGSVAALDTGSINSGLVGHWTLDGNDITTSIVDRSGNGNNGGFFGAATSGAKVAGKLGQALRFDGVDDYIQTPINQSFSSGTFAAWVKLNTASPTDFASPIFNRTGSEATGISINTSREIRYTWHNSIETWGFGTGLIVPVGQWVFMAASVNPTSATVYLYSDANGLQSTTTIPASGHIAVTLDNLKLGTDTCCGGRYWNGPMDDLRVYDRALSAAEIQQLINLGRGTQNSSVTKLQNGSSLTNGLVGHWTFDNLDFTDKVYDKSGSAHHGYVFNAATSTVKTQGRLGQGLNIGRTNKYVRVASTSALVFNSGPFSVAGWVNATTTATQMIAFHGLGCSTFASWYLSIGGNENNSAANKYAFGINTTAAGGGDKRVASSGNAATGRWVHMLGTYDGSSMLSLYIDGVLTATSSITGNPFASYEHLYLGEDPGCGGRFATGKIDDVRVYNRELTASEAKQLYNLGR